MASRKGRKCATCEFFVPIGKEEPRGECRALPPTPNLPAAARNGVWPEVWSTNWCGAWRSADAPD